LLDGSELVDGVAPVIIEPVAVQDRTSQQNEPRVTLFASDPAHMAGFGEIKQVGGGAVSLADLSPGEVYLNDEAADELNARPGDELLVFAADQFATLRLEGIVQYHGSGTDESAMLMPLDAAQRLLDKEGQIKHIIVSNRGGPLSGVDHTDEVIEQLEPGLGPLGLEVNPIKEDALDFANELGSLFTSFFVTFGVFSIVAGIMLIFLIFVMLAAERKSEMGMARAVGAQRRHLVQMFLFEGVAYDLVAAGIGALLGLAVAFGMVLLMARAFATFGVEIEHDFRPRSLIVAYTLGMLLTFIVVTVSAWRVSLLNIVTAIRDLPDTALPRGPEWKRGWLWGIMGLLLAHLYIPLSILVFALTLVRLKGLAAMLRGLRPPATWFLTVAGVELGLSLTLAGLAAEEATPFYLGISFLIIALVPLLRRLGLPDRAAYTLPGIALVVWWLLPFDALDFILPDFSSDFSIFIVSGIMLVFGGTWTVMYNSDLLLWATMAVFGRIRRLAPVLKTAISYPLTNRFRTGMTVAMFSLVVFTLVVMATLTNAFSDLFNDEEAFGGGFDIRATTVRISPVNDMAAAVEMSEGLDPGDIQVVASQSVLSLEAKQAGLEGQEFEDYPVRGFDDEFLASNTYGFALMAEGYDSPQEAWQALADNPGLAVVDPIPVPRRDNFGGQAGAPDFKLEGFYIEDKTFSPMDVEIQDPATGRTLRLTIIGVLKDTFPVFMLGIGTSQNLLAEAFGAQAQPTIHFFGLRDGVDTGATANALETAFLMNGMEAEVLKEELEKAVGAQLTFNYILQGFTGLGLMVGVAALGVISARSVVERRQQIGVLRAIGFQRRMVQLSFLLESSFVAILGIAVGSVLGLILSFNIIEDASTQGSAENIEFAVPWLNLSIIFLLAYGASLLTTFLPARQASRVYPAEALRYE
jgi:putative ABC transport system permease protein